MSSMLSKTLNEQKQPLDDGGYNVPDGVNPELSKGQMALDEMEAID